VTTKTPTTAPALAPMDVASRLPRLRERLDGAGCDALVVTNLSNVRYLTGFTGSAGILLVAPEDAVLVTDGRYSTQSVEQVGAAGVETRVEIGGVAAQLEVLAKAATGMARVGLEAPHVTWARQRAFGADVFQEAELVPTEGLVEALRRVKDDGELARMEAAAGIADAALVRARKLLPDGVTEADLALELDFEMRRLGAEGSSFETIVASGPNGAKPHARPSARRIGEGELVVIDFGAIVDGYCSDMTRTLWAGDLGSGVTGRMVEVVASSQAAGVRAVKAGASCAEIDGACREVIAEAGWADAFLHSTGHGVGLDIHEAPWVAATSTDTLEAASVVTVEPGVYLPDVGGVRIEDTVVVTAEGCRALTKSPKDLIGT
jgi:Xaa-Pro aminopeptidase